MLVCMHAHEYEMCVLNLCRESVTVSFFFVSLLASFHVCVPVCVFNLKDHLGGDSTAACTFIGYSMLIHVVVALPSKVQTNNSLQL